MTEYTLRVPTAMCGDVIALCLVAEAMARHAASGYGTLTLHKPTFDNLLPTHIDVLLSAARAGRLLVCNHAGKQGTVDEIIDAAKNSGDLSEVRRYLVEPDWEKLHRDNPPVVEGVGVWNFSGLDLGATETDWDMTHLLSLYVRKKHLIDWGNANGDVFHIVDAPVEVVEFGPKNELGEFAFRGFVGGMSHTPATKVEAGTGTSPSGGDWEVQARAIADECFDIDTKGGCRDSLKGYSKRVMELMQERGIKGSRGIIDNPNYVMREALQSDFWWKSKSK